MSVSHPTVTDMSLSLITICDQTRWSSMDTTDSKIIQSLWMIWLRFNTLKHKSIPDLTFSKSALNHIYYINNKIHFLLINRRKLIETQLTQIKKECRWEQCEESCNGERENRTVSSVLQHVSKFKHSVTRSPRFDLSILSVCRFGINDCRKLKT